MHAPLLRPGWLTDLPHDPDFDAHVQPPARQTAQAAGVQPSQSNQTGSTLTTGVGSAGKAAQQQSHSAADAHSVPADTPQHAAAQESRVAAVGAEQGLAHPAQAAPTNASRAADVAGAQPRPDVPAVDPIAAQTYSAAVAAASSTAITGQQAPRPRAEQDSKQLPESEATQAAKGAEQAAVTAHKDAQQDSQPGRGKDKTKQQHSAAKEDSAAEQLPAPEVEPQRAPVAPRPNTWSSMRKLPNLHESLKWQ